MNERRNCILPTIPSQGNMNNNLPWEGILLPQQPLPDWMKPALEERFNELAQIGSKLDEVAVLYDKQIAIEQQIKQSPPYWESR